MTALTRADSAVAASALFAPGNLAPPPAGGFTSTDPFGVYFDFSSSSGDQVNPINALFNTLWLLKEMTADQDTLHDLRWLGKFSSNSAVIQQPVYSPARPSGTTPRIPRPTLPCRSSGMRV